MEELYADCKDRVCLLDPSAAQDLSPEDGERFDVFLFGGILGASRFLAPLLGFARVRARLGVFYTRTNDDLGDDPPRGTSLSALEP